MIISVTGASSGFGAAITRRFVSAGHRVIAIGRRQSRLEALADELGPNLVYPLALDVQDRDAIEFAVSALPADFAEVDLLVNNAGLAAGWTPCTRRTLKTGTR